MRFFWIGIVLVGIVFLGADFAQGQPASESLSITAKNAWTWAEGETSVVQFEGPVTFTMDNVRMTADNAVIWLKPMRGNVFDQQQVEIALIGNASLKQQEVKRTGDRLFITATVRGSIRVTADQRLTRDQSATPLYKEAGAMREESGLAKRVEPGRWRTPRAKAFPETTTGPLAAPATTVHPAPPVRIQFGSLETTRTSDDRIAAVLSGKITIIARQEKAGLIELQADRAVVFTSLKSFRDTQKKDQTSQIEDSVEGVYLDGDVRITYTPQDARMPEGRLEANRAYYEFTTDRAILTDAVIHSTEPKSQIPIIIRAQTVRQLSKTENQTEYSAEKVELTTSAFATPSYALAADRAYVREVESGDPDVGTRTNFSAQNATIDLFGLPAFWLPAAGGSVTNNGIPLRSLDIGNSSRFGFNERSEWGLFESLGKPRPRDLDLWYHADYFGKRGPATGLDGEYRGGFVTDTTREPWNFGGQFRSYFINDTGTDELGGARTDVTPPDSLRGRVEWQHQHFLPDDWQVQLRGAWISDPTFLEEWFPEEFYDEGPHNVAAYIKHQHDTEALTLLVEAQPNDFVTTADYMQERLEVQRQPELGYHRIGESFGDDNFTFFSDNTVSRLQYQPRNTNLAKQGFGPDTESPGIPSIGTTGVTDDAVDRGDFRQEINYPVTLGQFRAVPYVVGRYTGYNDSPTSGAEDRLYAGTGLRITTAFWRVDDGAQSDLFDIHRVRHVIEPEANFYTSAQTTDRNELFIYDEQVDAINDISAAQFALRQRWQTKRGGPGHWRSVDFFTLNTEANFFGNQPDENNLDPTNFRGLYFPSLPEASIPRNSLNADAMWRVSDTTAVLADTQYNTDEQTLATASIGLAVQRGDRLTYFVGDRYIEDLDSDIATFAAAYELSTKYTLGFGQSFDLRSHNNSSSDISVIRRFDRFFVAMTVSHDQVSGSNGFFITVRPEGLPYMSRSGALQRVFQRY